MDKQIPLPQEALAVIVKASQQIEEIRHQLRLYADGLRHGLNVPAGWVLDMEKHAFVPDPGQGPSGADAPAGESVGVEN